MKIPEQLKKRFMRLTKLVYNKRMRLDWFSASLQAVSDREVYKEVNLDTTKFFYEKLGGGFAVNLRGKSPLIITS